MFGGKQNEKKDPMLVCIACQDSLSREDLTLGYEMGMKPWPIQYLFETIQSERSNWHM